MTIKRMIQNWLCITQENTENIQHDLLMPKARRDDDIFILSYPKSGNTWISFILANIIVEKLGLDVEVNFFNIHGFIPDIHQGQDIPADLGFFPFKRFIKSHATFHQSYKNVIYIIRDPRSVMVSYYKFLVGLGRINEGLSEFILDKKLGIDAWIAHVQGWIDGIVPGTRFKIVRYEDFKSNPENTIKKLAKLIGMVLSEDNLKSIIDKSSFENMKKLEIDSGSLSIKKHDKYFNFVRKGSIAEWKTELSERDITYITKAAMPLMKRFGYL